MITKTISASEIAKLRKVCKRLGMFKAVCQLLYVSFRIGKEVAEFLGWI